MRNKETWFNPYHNSANKKRKKLASQRGRDKTLSCQKRYPKQLLCSARAYKTHPHLYARWDEVFSKR